MKRQNSEAGSRNSEEKNRITLFHLLTPDSRLPASIPFLLCVALAGNARAETPTDQWHLCPAFRLVDNPAITGDVINRVFADADSIETLNNGVSRLNGNVSILHDGKELFADEVLFNRTQQKFELSGNTRYRSQQLELTGTHMFSYGNSDRLEITDAQFYFPAQHASGHARSIERTETGITSLINTSYSTCDPADTDWEFRASRITLDQAKGEGNARNMSIYFKNVPIFYFPALSFPLDDRRKSGFLLPHIGDSDKHGFELATPYYWNIAPQADATLTPQHMAERGTKLDSEWRYLNRWSMNQLQLEYMNDKLSAAKRDLTGLRHNGRFGGNWYSRVNYTEVSDNDYFDDFGSSLNDSSLTHLQQEFTIGAYWQNWEFSSQMLDYQTIDETIAANPNNLPYQLRPSLQLRGHYPQFGEYLDLSLQSSLSNFEHNSLPTAHRFDFQPRIAFPFGSSGWYLTPALSTRHTSYRVEDPMLPADTVEISRNVPTFSLDSGLIFERSIDTDGGLLQTLEPRLFLLKTPFRAQDDIPVFDSGVPDFSFAQLFSENRFVGADRVGDAEQISLALSSSILRRETGDEILRAGIGQTYYNEERRVTLPGQTQDTQDRSDVLAEIKAWFYSRWSASLAVEWNSERDATDKQLFRLRYQRDNRHIFNLAYRARTTTTGDIEQSDISFAWPLSDHWSAVGRWNRSLDEDVNLERFAGLQYESCCYVFQLVTREYLTEEQTQNSSVFFQLSLKGLTSLGDNTDELLEGGIPGYQNFY